MQSFTQRMIGAAKLHPPTYEEVEHDGSATGQAALVVVLAALAAGIGAMGAMGGSIGFLLLNAVAALLGWLIWAALIWAIGTKLLPEAQTEADIGQLLRTLGFAATPGLLRVFGIIPVLGSIIWVVASLWMLATTVIAVRQALDYTSTLRAVGVCAIGWLAQLLIMALIGGVAGPAGPAPGM